MEQYVFFTALSTSILTSVVQGFIIYIIAKLLLSAVPELSAANKFRFWYGANVLLFAGFIVSLLLNYTSGIIKTEAFTSQFSIVPTFAASSEKAVVYSTDYKQWIALLYFVGLIVQTGIMITGFFQLRAIRTKAQISEGSLWMIKIEQLSSKLNLSIKVDLRFTERIFSPFTAGFIKPIIIFPIAMLNRLTEEQVEAILLHELAHIRRNDYLLNIFHKIIETALFFNPLVWLISKEIRREREFACDDIVVEHSGDSKQYARALLHIAESKLTDPAFGMAASGNRFSLFNRIKRLTTMDTPKNTSKSSLFAIVSIAAACLSLAWVVPSDTIPAKKDTISRQETSPVSFTYGAEPEIPAAPPAPPLPPLPPLRAVLKALPPLPADTDSIKAKANFNSTEWKKYAEDMAAYGVEMKKHFEGTEFKKHMSDMLASVAEMRTKFDSPEFKKDMENMKLSAEAMKKKFDSPEWKKKMADMKLSAEEMSKQFDSPEWKQKIADMKLNAEEMRKQFDSPEWKQKMEELKFNSAEIKKQFESPEWKKQMDELKQQALDMKLQHEKTLKSSPKVNP